jgi:uncharacterized membrane protein required for colicin V production
MVIDAGIVVILAISAIHGYCQGLVRGTVSLATLVVTILLAVQSCDDLARFFLSSSAVPPVALVFCFLLMLAAEWAALLGLRKLLGRALDVSWLDQFAGGIGGLGRGIAGAWLGVAAIAGAFPQSLPVIARSTASMRMLAVSGMPRNNLEEPPDQNGATVDSSDFKCVAEHRGKLNLKTY